jgi:hypothetical protein
MMCMKVSKRTNRICLGLTITALVAIFIYQVGFAKATNESVRVSPVDTYCAPGSIACGEIHFHGGDGPHCYGGGDCGGGSGDGGSDDGGGDDN